MPSPVFESFLEIVMKWSAEYTVNVNDADCNNILSASGIFRFMQDAANREMKEHGPSYDELFESGLAFVLCRIRMSSYSPIRVHDTITVETWACETKGIQFDRCFRILREGIIVAEAVSAWALVGTADRKLHRTTELCSNYVRGDMLELDLPSRMKIPEDTPLVLRGERTVEYADIDINGHMNNTKYPDIMCGFLDESMNGKRVISIAVSFVNEAPLGESIKYYAGMSDDIHYVRSVRSDGKTNAEAEIILDQLEVK